MRSRVFDDLTTSAVLPLKYWDSGNLLVNTQTLYTSMRLKDQMDDVVTPHYRELSAQGRIIQSPKAKETVWFTQKASLVDCSCVHTLDQRPRRTYQGSLARVGLTVPPILIGDAGAWQNAFEAFQQEVDLAITRAHANVSVSEMQVLATIGEFPETVNWLVSCMKRLVKVTKAFTKRREMVGVLRTLTYNLQEASTPKGATFAQRRLDLYKRLLQTREAKKLPTDSVGAVATAWLEYRYAIRPLLGDIKNAITAIQKQLEYAKRQTARGKELRVYDDINIDYDDPSPSDRILVEDLKIARKGLVKASAGVLYAIERNIAALASILGLDQPVESLYELIPFSFVLDWVVNVGEWLQSLTQTSGLSLLSSWVTLTYVEEVAVTPLNWRIRHYPSDTHQWKINEYTKGGSASKVTRVWRVPNPQIPLLPSFDLKVNLPKILDLGFILRQILSGESISVVKRS